MMVRGIVRQVSRRVVGVGKELKYNLRLLV
jgi:hypothetical protein